MGPSLGLMLRLGEEDAEGEGRKWEGNGGGEDMTVVWKVKGHNGKELWGENERFSFKAAI